MHLRRSLGDSIFDIANTIFLILVAIVTLYPFWHVLIGSIVPYDEAIRTAIRILPKKITFDAYAYVFSTEKLIKAAGVSVFVTATTTVYQLLVTSMIAYVLTKREMPGRNIIFTLIIITMFFSGGLIPYYLLIKKLNLIDNIWVLVIPYAVNTWWIFILKTFFGTLPKELEESSKIDGAGYFRIFFSIILPLSAPSMATIGLFTAVSKWNEWFAPMIFLNDAGKWPLTLVLRDIIVQSETEIAKSIGFQTDNFMSQENIKMAVIMVSIIPILLIYPFVQKHFVKGVMIGSVKS